MTDTLREHLDTIRVKALQTKRRRADERLADQLRGRGWTCTPPTEPHKS